MNMWQRFKNWLAMPDPNDNVESTNFPLGTNPIPEDLFVPGESQRVLQLDLDLDLGEKE